MSEKDGRRNWFVAGEDHKKSDSDNKENSLQKGEGIKDFYFTIVNFHKGVEQKAGESDDAFEKRKARRQKQFEVAVASIQEKTGIDMNLPGGLEKAKAIIQAELVGHIKQAGSAHEQVLAQKNLLNIFGVRLNKEGDYEGSDAKVVKEAPEVKRIGLAKLVARGDVEAGLRLLGLRYDLSQKEAGWIKSIADRDRIVPLIELVLDNDADAAKARERLRAFYKISGSDEQLEQILLEKEDSAADAEENLERLFGLAGAAEILKQIEKL